MKNRKKKNICILLYTEKRFKLTTDRGKKIGFFFCLNMMLCFVQHIFPSTRFLFSGTTKVQLLTIFFSVCLFFSHFSPFSIHSFGWHGFSRKFMATKIIWCTSKAAWLTRIMCCRCSSCSFKIAFYKKNKITNNLLLIVSIVSIVLPF